MASRFYLRCLGQPALLGPGGTPVRLRTRKHLALLVYLAVEPRQVHRRDRLTDLLWSSAPDAEARHSLSTGLSVLRGKLGPGALECGRDQVRLVHPAIALDLDRLAAGDIFASEFAPMLEVASFLDGFDIADADEFAHWKDRQQARWLPAIRDGLVRLMDRCRRTGDSREIELLADRMLALDELSEDAIRAKMEARAFAGDRLTALKCYEAWERKLSEELGAVPSALLEGMAMRLRRRGWERTATSNIPTVPTDQWKGRAFIGRANEYRTLYEGWERMREGGTGHALVLGDSGIGKSTLVERLTTAAGLEGAVVSRVQCYELEREIPYAAAGSLVQGLLDRPGASGAPPEALAELSRTVPEVRRRFPTIPPPQESQGETARIRLTEAFHQLVLSIAEEHPVILVVDDIHLADDASLAVLHLMMRRSSGQPIIVILISRPAELHQAPQASRIRESAESLGIRTIGLPPMSDEEGADLIMSRLPADTTPPSSTVRRSLIRAAAGYPMVLELLLHDWQTSGEQCLAMSVGAMTQDVRDGGLPEVAYRQILERIARSLDALTRNVLNLAAILGHRLNDVGLYGLVDLTVGQTMTGMARLVELRLLRDGGQGLEFVNELVRVHAYLGVPSPLRKALHSSIADRLLDGPEPAPGLEIAWHCIRAGRLEEATPHLLRGAREAMYQGAPYEAERGLRTALPRISADQQIRAVLLLCEALFEQGLWIEAQELLAAHHERLTTSHADIVFALSSIANVRTGRLQARESLPVITRLFENLRSASDPETLLRTAQASAFLVAECRNIELAREALALLPTESCVISLEGGVEELVLCRAMMLYQVRETTASFDLTLRTVHRLQNSGMANSTIARLYLGLGAMKCASGGYCEAITYLKAAYDVASRLGNDTLGWSASANVSLCYGRLRRYQEQLEWGLRAYSENPIYWRRFTAVQASHSIAFAQAMLGRHEEALTTMATLNSKLIAPSIPDWVHQAKHFHTADVLQITGRKAEARIVASKAFLDEGKLHSLAFAGSYVRWVAMTARTALPPGTEAELRRIVANLDQCDSIDQVEIIESLACIERKFGYSIAANLQALRGERLQLMADFSDHLAQFGLPGLA